MGIQHATLPQSELLSPLTLLRHAWQICGAAVARWQQRRRLYDELANLDRRVMSDLMLQPHDLMQLLRGRTTPAAAERIELARRH